MLQRSRTRIAGRMPTYLYGLRNRAPAVLLYSASEAVINTLELPPITLRQETDFSSSGEVTLHVSPAQPARFPLHLRIPPYAAGASAQVGTDQPISAQAGDFLVIDREWHSSDTVKLSLPFSLTCQANGMALALVRGPLVYAYFQDAQPNPVVFHYRRGLYPEDVNLYLDPVQPSNGVQAVFRIFLGLYRAHWGSNSNPNWTAESISWGNKNCRTNALCNMVRK